MFLNAHDESQEPLSFIPERCAATTMSLCRFSSSPFTHLPMQMHRTASSLTLSLAFVGDWEQDSRLAPVWFSLINIHVCNAPSTDLIHTSAWLSSQSCGKGPYINEDLVNWQQDWFCFALLNKTAWKDEIHLLPSSLCTTDVMKVSSTAPPPVGAALRDMFLTALSLLASSISSLHH